MRTVAFDLDGRQSLIIPETLVDLERFHQPGFNRASYASIDDALAANNHKVAAFDGYKRVMSKADEMINGNFKWSKAGIVVVYPNPQAKDKNNPDFWYCLDANTKFEAIKYIWKTKSEELAKSIIENLTIRIDYSITNDDEGHLETIEFNKNPTKGWSADDALNDFCKRDSEEYNSDFAKKLLDAPGEFEKRTGYKVPSNIVYDALAGGQTRFCDFMTKFWLKVRITHLNERAEKYLFDFLPSIIADAQKTDDEGIIKNAKTLCNSYQLKSLYHVFMCASKLDIENNCTDYSELLKKVVKFGMFGNDVTAKGRFDAVLLTKNNKDFNKYYQDMVEDLLFESSTFENYRKVFNKNDVKLLENLHNVMSSVFHKFAVANKDGYRINGNEPFIGFIEKSGCKIKTRR